jgi:hypothetical protein
MRRGTVVKATVLAATALLGVVLSVLSSGDHVRDTAVATGPVPGEWTLQRDTTIGPVGSAGETAYLYAWISRVDGKKITVMHQLVDVTGKNGLTLPKPNVVESLGDAKRLNPASHYPEETITVKGKTFSCRKVGVGGELLWVAPEIPVYGLVRAVVKKDGRTIRTSDLIDWGASGGSERPTK